MKITGIIAEYNPFHNGHAYQIKKAKELSRADCVVAVMSGNFVQRGAPAILDKYSRTYLALSGGADFVFELPTVWATASAEYFAAAGVALLDALGCADVISFGCETPDLTLMSCIAEILADEPGAYQELLDSFLRQNMTFPAARKQALLSYLSQITCEYPNSLLSELLDSPNNILALEYIKALRRQNSSLRPLPVKRQGSGYHDTDLNQAFCSATALRNLLTASKTQQNISHLSDALSRFTPKEVSSFLQTSNVPVVTEDDFSAMLYYKLLCGRDCGFWDYADGSRDLSNRICRFLSDFNGCKSFCEMLKSRDMTYTRISRLLFHILLNIRREDYETGKNIGYIPYLRLLGFREESSGFFSELTKYARIPLITRPAKELAHLTDGACSMLQKDIFASDLYYGILSQKYRIHQKNELQRGLVKYPMEKSPLQ